MVNCIYLGVTGYNFQLKLNNFCEDHLSVYPDETPHYAALHLRLHCLPNFSLGVSSNKGLRTKYMSKHLN